MQKYKMIALDMDGTLTNDDKLITEKTKNALIEVQKQGAILVLASGRPTTGLYKEAEELKMDKFGGYLLSYNGARISRAVDKSILFEKRLPTDILQELVTHISKFPVTIMYDDGENLYTTNENGYAVAIERSITHLNLKKITDIESIVNGNPIKLLMSAEPSIMRKTEEEIGLPFKQLEFVRSAPFFLEAIDKGVSKGSSLKLLADKLGLKREEIMAFGDEHNDISMLEYAGLGIGMENACDEVLNMCDFVTLSNNNDGVAHVLKEHFNNL